MGFSRQECWSGLPFPSPEDLPDPGIKPASPALAVGFFIPLSHLGSPHVTLGFIKKIFFLENSEENKSPYLLLIFIYVLFLAWRIPWTEDPGDRGVAESDMTE